jgi:hypothetical protein
MLWVPLKYKYQSWLLLCSIQTRQTTHIMLLLELAAKQSQGHNCNPNFYSHTISITQNGK